MKNYPKSGNTKFITLFRLYYVVSSHLVAVIKISKHSRFFYVLFVATINFWFFSFQYDPEGFGEIPWEDFLEVLKNPDFIAEVDANKREILAEKAQEGKTSAITFQDFVNVVSLNPAIFEELFRLSNKQLSLVTDNYRCLWSSPAR